MHGLKELRSLLNDVQEKRRLKVFDEPGLLIYYNQTVDPEKVINMPSLKDLAFIVSEKRQRSARI